MEEKKKVQSKAEKLANDFKIFQEKSKKLTTDKKSEFNRYFERLEFDLELSKLSGSTEKQNEFYQLFAEFTEKSNAFKMLYQILSVEYFHLGIFTQTERDNLQQIAVVKIKKLILNDEWHGVGNLNNRAAFRFEMMDLIRAKVHESAAQREKKGERIAAVCFSGGGIRSATFGLGVLQGLAKHKLLSKFDYISTVSGGGYIGSWLSAWIHRVGLGDSEIEGSATQEAWENKTFSNDNAAKIERLLVQQTANSPEPAEITHLRSYSNYMSPRPGMFSADTWTLIAVYLRNLLLNWTVFVPLIAAALLLPKIYATVLSLDYAGNHRLFFFVVALAAGLGGVLNINALRPSWKTYSWIDQTFKENEIGLYSSVESKVFRWVLLFILALAFSVTTFFAWNGMNLHFPLSDWLAAKLNIDNAKTTLIDLILFSEMLFVGGYFLAWLLMLPKYLLVRQRAAKHSTKLTANLRRFYATYLREVCVSIVCGLISGGLYYLLLNNLANLNRYFYKLLGDDKFDPNSTIVTPEFLACFGVPLFLIVFLLSATVFVGFAVRFTDDEDREWMARFGAWLLMLILGWSVISTAVIFGPRLFNVSWGKIILPAVGGVSGLITLVLGFSKKSAAKADAEPKTKKSFLLWFAPAVAAPVFVLFLAILISHLTNLLVKYVVIFENFRNLTWLVILVLIGFVMGYFININKFSFHAIYRERLIRAYLGASRTKKRLYTANSFTGLDSENDNLEMSRLKQKPFHVVNMTLNLVKTHNLRWQNRKAESFTATALHCGSANMGDGSGNYRSSEDYAFNKQNGRAITLGTAAAISGAAASPNMGYYTMSAAVSFLMVLFNVRLGWWLGNPGRRGEKTFKQPAPRWSPRLFLDESIGGTDDSKPYVYLSDGGHFDNLGLYEMVLRRCHLIVVSDAACDADFGFSDFGTAIHKIRVDLGIPIEFEKEKHPVKNRNCGIGIIKYTCVDKSADAEDGVLIYIKPTLDGDEPIDLKNYKRENPEFPHESTADQMYSETQFESYRSLGLHMADSISCGQLKCNCENLADLEANAGKYIKNFAKHKD